MGWKTPRAEIRPGPLYRSCCNVINANRPRHATVGGASQPAGVRLGVGVGPPFELRPRSPRVSPRIVLQPALSCSGARNYHHAWLGQSCARPVVARADAELALERPDEVREGVAADREGHFTWRVRRVEHDETRQPPGVCVVSLPRWSPRERYIIDSLQRT